MGNCVTIDILATEVRALRVGSWEEVIQVKIDELFENLEQAMVLAGLAFCALLFVAAICCRIYAFLFTRFILSSQTIDCGSLREV